jgi:hypothetical protein
MAGVGCVFYAARVLLRAKARRRWQLCLELLSPVLLLAITYGLGWAVSTQARFQVRLLEQSAESSAHVALPVGGVQNQVGQVEKTTSRRTVSTQPSSPLNASALRWYPAMIPAD